MSISTPLVTIHPYSDLTGESSDYLVINEIQDLAAKDADIFVLNNGPFYSNSLEIVNADTGDPLIPKEDYEVGLLNPLATAASKGKLSVWSTINLTEKWADKPLPKLMVTYQFVGGPYALNIEALQQAVKDLQSKPTLVYWDNVQGKPVAFPPEWHPHDAADIYGTEECVAVLMEINASILYLAETLATSAVPEDNVVYGGVTKYTIDQGTRLTNYTVPLVLQLPRASVENALVMLTGVYLSGGKTYHFQLNYEETVTEGFKDCRFESDMVTDFQLTLAYMKTHDGVNYLKLEVDAANAEGFKSGGIVVNEVIVFTDNTEEYNQFYQWKADYPVDGSEVACAIVNTAT